MEPQENNNFIYCPGCGKKIIVPTDAAQFFFCFRCGLKIDRDIITQTTSEAASDHLDISPLAESESEADPDDTLIIPNAVSSESSDSDDISKVEPLSESTNELKDDDASEALVTTVESVQALDSPIEIPEPEFTVAGPSAWSKCKSAFNQYVKQKKALITYLKANDEYNKRPQNLATMSLRFLRSHWDILSSLILALITSTLWLAFIRISFWLTFLITFLGHAVIWVIVENLIYRKCLKFKYSDNKSQMLADDWKRFKAFFKRSTGAYLWLCIILVIFLFGLLLHLRPSHTTSGNNSSTVSDSVSAVETTPTPEPEVTITMPDVTGKSWLDAKAKLEALGFEHVTTAADEDPNVDISQLIVTGQNITAGTEAKASKYIVLICKLPVHVEITVKSATNIFFSTYDMEVFFDDNRLGYVSNGDTLAVKGDVVPGSHTITAKRANESSPSASMEIEIKSGAIFSCTLKHSSSSIEFSNIDLTDYDFGTEIEAINVTDMPLTDALDALNDAGFTNVKVSYPSGQSYDNKNNWYVTDQEISAGTKLFSNEPFTLDIIKLDDYFETLYDGMTLKDVLEAAPFFDFTIKYWDKDTNKQIDVDSIEDAELEYWVLDSVKQNGTSRGILMYFENTFEADDPDDIAAPAEEETADTSDNLAFMGTGTTVDFYYLLSPSDNTVIYFTTAGKESHGTFTIPDATTYDIYFADTAESALITYNAEAHSAILTYNGTDYHMSEEDYDTAYLIYQSGKGAVNTSTIEWKGVGTYAIGTDLEPGEYVIKSTNSTYPAYMKLSSDSSGRISSIIENDNFFGYFFVTASSGQYLEVSRGQIAKADNIVLDVDSSNLDEGMYRVGIDIPAGTYKCTIAEDAFWFGTYTVYSNDSTFPISVIDNFESTSYITVYNGQYLKLSSCTAALQ